MTDNLYSDVYNNISFSRAETSLIMDPVHSNSQGNVHGGELMKIMDWKGKYGRIVIPIFYHVDPSDVEQQNGEFGEKFRTLENKFMDKFRRWKTALTEAANLPGWDSRNFRYVIKIC